MKIQYKFLTSNTPFTSKHLIACFSMGILTACQQAATEQEIVRIPLSIHEETATNEVINTLERYPLNPPKTDLKIKSTTETATTHALPAEQVAIHLPSKPNSVQPKLQRIIESALNFNYQNSPSPLIVLQRQAESEAINRSHWPTIQPTARWDKNNKAYAGIEAAYTFLDFGVSTQREKQGDLNVHLAQIDFNLEQRNIAADILSELAIIFSLKEKNRLIQEALIGLNQLAHYADIRVQAGFINESEPLLLNLRIAELNAEKEALSAEISLKIKLLSAKLLEPVSIVDIPSFKEMKANILPVRHTAALQRRRAELNAQIARSKLTQTERSRLPQLAIEGGIGIGLSQGASKQHNIGLVLKSPTSLFTGGANVRAAEAEFRAAEQEAKQTQTKVDTELERIQLEQKRLNENRKTLLQLEKEGQHALTLFKAQFEAATATISDGLNAHRTLLQTRQQLMDLEAELLHLNASEIRISEGEFLVK